MGTGRLRRDRAGGSRRERAGAGGSRREEAGAVGGESRPLPSAPARSRLLPPAPVPFELLTVGSGDGVLEQMLQAQLARAGFRVALRQLELSAFLDRLYGPAHDFDAAVLGIPGDLGLGYLGPLAGVAGMAAPRDPVEAERLFADSVPVAFLYHARGVQGLTRRVQGVRMDIRGELATVHDWWVTR
jgi:peptide/nickel transport system substrate-binding protein